jgi:Asp-tRNA(Asn)/Glu-tRNA(Gln) amidotransferase C subunit
MDLRTGKTYETEQAALADGVPESDIALVEQRLRDGKPIVKFSKGSFKSFVRAEDGQLVRVP